MAYSKTLQNALGSPYLSIHGMGLAFNFTILMSLAIWAAWYLDYLAIGDLKNYSIVFSNMIEITIIIIYFILGLLAFTLHDGANVYCFPLSAIRNRLH